MKKVKEEASPIKIAYYVQNMLDKKIDRKDIILIVSSQFNKKSLKHFAELYKDCIYRDDVRQIANIIYSVSHKTLIKS